jgi:urease accessory protein
MISLHSAPELAPYHDEPKQLPSGAPGKNGLLRLGFELRGRRTVLAHLERQAPLLAQQALYFDEEMPDLPCVMVISTSGGILQGDRYEVEINLADGTEAHVTTQSATKIQEMDANYALQSQEIVLGENSYLEYLPAPVIPYRHSRFLTHTRISIAPSATLLYSEILLPGRKYYRHGEVFEYNLFSSFVSAGRPGGKQLFVEKFVIEPQKRNPRQPAVMGRFDVLANLLLLTPRDQADRVLENTPASLNRAEGWAAGASRLPNHAGLIYKVLGMEREIVQTKVREFWSVVRQQVKGTKVPEEFRWR